MIDEAGLYLNNKCFLSPLKSWDIVALLNSSVFWFQLFALARAKRGGYLEAEAQYVEQLPIPDLTPEARARLAALGEACTTAARSRWTVISAVRRRILDLAPPERRKLNGKLEDWHELDFGGFLAEVRKAFRADIPLKQRGEWQDLLTEKRREVEALSGEIERAEREIDALVYAAFDLTPDEIALLERSLEGQY